METAREPISDGKFQEKFVKAQEDILQLKIQLRDKNQALEDSLLTGNNLKKKIAQLIEENRQLSIKNAQMLKEIQQKAKIIELNDFKSQTQPQKINLDIVNEVSQKISELTQKIQQIQAKNNQLSEEVKKQTSLASQFQNKYNEETERVSHLIKVMHQVQEDFSDAKKFRDKTFQEQYNKLLHQSKKLQVKCRQLKEENEKLKNEREQNENPKQKEIEKQEEVENERENEKYKQKIKILENNFVKNICTISLHFEQGLKLTDAEKEISELKAREEAWMNEKIALQNDLKFKEEDINRFHWQVYELQKSLSDLKISQASLKKSLDEANKKIYALIPSENSRPVASKPQSSKQLNYYDDPYYLTPETKAIFQTPVPNAVEYVKRIANTIGVYWTEIYYELDGQYILDHSNIPIDIDEFLVYDWTRLKQVNFYNSKFDVEKWSRLAENAKKFPRLDMVYLHGNSLTFVKQQDLSKFKKLKSVFFKYTDQTRGLNPSVYPPVYMQKNN